ncbi:MAG: multicomponent Na+:H+ antiporter subunit E [Bacillota bacterium]|nr:MAG: multicomponent Na+:H+ antiporter subunit E [Bacillota bacterium]
MCMRRIGWSAALFLLWLLFAQSFHWQTVLTGLVVAAVVTVLNDDLLLSLSGDLHVNVRNLGAWAILFSLLIVEIVKSGWQVAVLALSFELKLQPVFITHKSSLVEPMMRVTLANSITLTPGTITVEAPLTGDFVVHALTSDAGEGLRDWHIENRLAAIERVR